MVSGAFTNTGGTCGFGDFNDSVQFFEFPRVHVVPGPGNDFGVDGLNFTPSDLPPGVVGFYDGTLNPDGTGTITSYHVEDACAHAWQVNLSNPQPLSTPYPDTDFQ